MTQENEAIEVVRRMSDVPWVSWVWVALFSVLGGCVSWAQKCRAGQARWFNVVEFVGEIAISAFTGVITFMFLRSYGVDEMPAVACTGIASHMGTRGLYVLEQYVSKKFGLDPAPPGQ